MVIEPFFKLNTVMPLYPAIDSTSPVMSKRIVSPAIHSAVSALIATGVYLSSFFSSGFSSGFSSFLSSFCSVSSPYLSKNDSSASFGFPSLVCSGS